MARFRCAAAGCTVITERRRAPATCPDTNRCEFEECLEPPASPSPKPEPEPLSVSPLRVEIGGQAWPVTGTVVLGRNGDLALESFREHVSVSRRHCQLSCAGREWILRVLSEASPAVLDGQTIQAGKQVTLAGPAHELVLGGSMHLRLVLGAAPKPFVGTLDELLGGISG